MSFKRIEDDIIPILKDSYAARCDDMALYTYYAYHKIERLGLGAGWLERVFTDRRLRILSGIAPYESVSRVRRKLQEENPELRAPKEVVKERKRVEREYKQYAKEGGIL